MLESLVRSNIPRLQSFYDCFPSPARHLMTSARGWFLTQIRYSTEARAILRELRRHESWSWHQIYDHQCNELRQIVDHARRTVPYYAGYPDAEIRCPADLRQLPVLHRETVRQNQERLLSATTPQRRRIRAGTTGTTGANLRVAYTEELARENWAHLLRQWSWAGVEPRTPRVTLFGARIVPSNRTGPPFWTFNLAERQILMSIFHISESTAPAYLDFLESQSGKILEGFPSVLGIVADFALRRGRPIPMRVIFTSGEPLYASVRAKIEQAFQARVFDSYGMTEYCGLIQECEHGQMHLLPEYGYLEILDEQDCPVEAGEEGYFVWTGFLNRAMPLIRYRIGDRGRWQPGSSCACGRAFPLVVPTITRESDVLRCPDGRLFSPRALNQLLKHSSSLRSCQFIHDRPERVVVRAVPSNGHATEDAMRIRASLQEMLGPGICVSAEIAAEPIARPGGKIPLIVNRVRQ
jgi:phenylacetate-CoA ligase